MRTRLFAGAAAALVVLVFGGAFALTSYNRDGIRAQALPGTVLQSGSASASGLIVEVKRATFSGTAVDVEIAVRAEDPGLTVAGVAPADAEIAGAVGLSVRVHNDGRSVLRFPAAAWPEGAAMTAQLLIRAVQVRGQTGRFERISGDWQLAIKLPQGKEAETARFVQALQPVVADVAGHEVVVVAFRTRSATVVRYELPLIVRPVAVPPALRAGGGAAVQLLQAQQEREGVVEAWFEATPDAVPLTLVLDGLVVSDLGSKAWTLNIALDAFEPPRPQGYEKRSLGAQRQATSDGPALVDVAWEYRVADVLLEITVAGLWDPGSSGFPVVLGDGAELTVHGVGLRPATSERGAQTIISVKLRGSKPPRNLTVTAKGETVPVPRVEVVLKP